MSSFFERLANSTLRKLINEALNKIFTKKTKEEKIPAPTPRSEPEGPKTHPWRLCSAGEHWVIEHGLSVPASSKGPASKTLRNGHCRTNSGTREVYTAQEFREIAHQHFESLRNDPEAMPAPDMLGFNDSDHNGNRYDLSIAGWVKFWNETLNPERPVTPDFIKALIATETGFRICPDTSSGDGLARGPLQITETTRKILHHDPGKELRDHLIELSIEESRETEPNVAAGVRWLYHKRQLLERRIGREASWEEAAAEYKGIFSQIGKNKKTDKIMKTLLEFHCQLKNKRRDRR